MKTHNMLIVAALLDCTGVVSTAHAADVDFVTRPAMVVNCREVGTLDIGPPYLNADVFSMNPRDKRATREAHELGADTVLVTYKDGHKLRGIAYRCAQ